MHEFCHDGCAAASFGAGHAGDFDVKDGSFAVADGAVFVEFYLVAGDDESWVAGGKGVDECEASGFVVAEWLEIVVENEWVNDGWYVFVVSFAAEKDGATFRHGIDIMVMVLGYTKNFFDFFSECFFGCAFVFFGFPTASC